jgi:rare lipoprotein A
MLFYLMFALLAAAPLPGHSAANSGHPFVDHGVKPSAGHWLDNLPAEVGGGQLRLASAASWYGPGFAGNRTSSGEVFNPGAMTAAHPYLPFGTRVRVTNRVNGKSVVVRINDRGPFVGGRAIDLSQGAAGRIGMISTGVVPVLIEVLR